MRAQNPDAHIDAQLPIVGDLPLRAFTRMVRARAYAVLERLRIGAAGLLRVARRRVCSAASWWPCVLSCAAQVLECCVDAPLSVLTNDPKIQARIPGYRSGLSRAVCCVCVCVCVVRARARVCVCVLCARARACVCMQRSIRASLTIVVMSCAACRFVCALLAGRAMCKTRNVRRARS